MNHIARRALMVRISKLLKVTTQNGATEGEAMNAAKMVADLLAEHDLTLESIADAVDEKMEEHRGTGGTHYVRLAGGAIADMTGTQFYWLGKIAIFFGQRRDTEIAHAMLDMLRNAMDGEWRKYRDSDTGKIYVRAYSLGRVRSTFMKAMAVRLAARIYKLNDERKAALRTGQGTAGTGTALVIIDEKAKIVEEARKAHFEAQGKKEPSEADLKRMFNEKKMPPGVKQAGYNAGCRIPIGGGITDAASALKIEADK